MASTLSNSAIINCTIDDLTLISPLDADGQKIINSADPSAPQDLVTLNYLETHSGGEVTLSTAQTITGQKTFTQTMLGNASTATAWAAPITMTAAGGDVNFTVNFQGNSPAVFTLQPTLGTVNSNVGTFTKLTVNGKGLTTAASQASLTDLSPPTADFSFGSHKLTNLTDPSGVQDAATKNYVDNNISGNLNVIAFSRVYNENAFGINGGPSVIEFLQVTQTVNDNCFSIELHVLSYQNSNNPTTPNTYSATYQINSMRDQTAGAWQILYPTSASHSKNDAVNLYPQIEIKVTGLVMNIRERRKNYGVNPGFMDIGYRCLTKNGQGAQVFEFINESSDPEPSVIYRNHVLNTYLADCVDVIFTSPTAGQVLSFDGTYWRNADVDGGTL